MEFKIITDIENPLFNRREIQGEIKTDVTPSREEVRKLISKKFNADEDAIKIKTIEGKFGSTEFVIVANIYKSKKEMDKVELKKKKDIESEKKKEEARKAQEEAKKAAEKPAEENKEASE